MYVCGNERGGSEREREREGEREEERKEECVSQAECETSTRP